MKHSLTIVLTGGGSGGHITPLLPLAHELKKSRPGVKLVYVGHRGDKFNIATDPSAGFDEIFRISGGKFRRYHGESLLRHLFDVKTIALNVRDFFRFVGAILTSLRLLNKVNPEVVFSKGGFVAVPVCLAAKIKKIPIITHDSDAVPGLANRIIGRWAKVHATGMPKEFYDYPAESTFFVGIPTSQEVKPVTDKMAAAYKKGLGLPESNRAILVTGGGNGSVKLNNLMVAAAPKLLSEVPDLYIIHLAGVKHLSSVRQSYKDTLTTSALSRVKTFDFVDNFYQYSGAADVIVTRAGASSLAEFALQGKACVVIPSPFLAAGHQLKNAQQLKKQSAAVVLDDSVSQQNFQDAVLDLLANPSRRAELAANLGSFAKADASRSLAKLILAMAQDENIRNAT